MALTISEINAVSHEYFDDTITATAYDESPFLKKLMSDGKMYVDGGTNIQIPIRYTELGQSEQRGFREEIPFESTPTRTALTLEWQNIVGQTAFFWDEKIKNAGKGRIINLLSDRSKELKEDLNEALSDAIWSVYTTESTSKIASIPLVVDSSNKYGGIDPTDVATSWAATEDTSTTTMSLYGGSGSLSYAIAQATFGTQKPNMYVTTRDLFNTFASIAEAQMRYEDTKMADLGFHNMTLFGDPVVADPHVAASSFFGLNMNQWEIACNSKNPISVTEWFDLTSQGRVNTLGKYAYWVGNLVCRQRKTNFKFTALTG